MKRQGIGLLVALALIVSVGTFSYLTVRNRNLRERAETHFRNSDELQKTGQPEAAIAEMRRALQIEPDYFEARIGLADLYEESDRYAEAIATLEEGIRIAPKDRARYLSHLCDIYALKKDYPNAIKALRESLALAPDNVPGYRQLAHLLASAKQWDEAEAVWRDFQARFPNDPSGSGARGLARIQRLREEAANPAAAKKPETPPPPTAAPDHGADGHTH